MRRLAWLPFIFLVGLTPQLPGAVAGQVDLVSRYIWRGFDLLPDNHPAIQPSLNIDMGRSGLSLNIWCSFALERREAFAGSDEIDLALAYAFSLPEGWDLSAGFTHYGYWFAEGFTFRSHTTQEIFAVIACTSLPLSPTLSVYYDLNLGSGLYVTLGGSHELAISARVNLGWGGLVSFNSRQYIDKTGFSDIDLYIKAPLTLGRLVLTPSLNLMIPLLDEVNEDAEIWFGISAAI